MNDTAPLAVVTASASGIGLKIAEALIRNGFRVVMSDIDGVRGAAEAARLGAVFRSCDVRDDAQLVALFEGLGTVSALVNNVGIAGPTAPVWELPVAAFREVVEVNLISHFRACQLAVPGMMAARAGAIVNLASVAGKIGFVNRSPYAASKWGVRGLTKTLANELGPYNIRVNAVMPGSVRGARIERVAAGRAAAEGISREDAEQRMLARQAIARFIEPEEIADTVAFLCSDRATAISGAAIEVSGGFE